MNAPRTQKALAVARHALEAAIALIDAVEDAPGAPTTAQSTSFYTAKTSPMGRRRFLRLAREGAFPSHRVGRTVFAPRDAVDAWIATQPNSKKPGRPTRDIDELLARAGIRPGPRKEHRA